MHKVKERRDLRRFYPIDVITFHKVEPWFYAPDALYDPPCPKCWHTQRGKLTEIPWKGGTLWTCWNGCGQRYYTPY